VKLGLYIPSFTWPGGPEQIGPTLARIARTADGVQGAIGALRGVHHVTPIEIVGRGT